MPPAPPPEPARTAVIVVHGVADQAPDESARAIVDLLATINTPNRAAYGAFVEDDLRIDVEPLTNGQGPTRGFSGLADDLAAARDAGVAAPDARAALRAEPDIALMHDLLAEHVPTGADVAYRTVRLRGPRLGGPARTIDVHELYWADLSRVGAGSLRMLGELYQVLFHVSCLGGHVAAAAAIDDARHNRAWYVLRWAHGQASYVLAVIAPLLNLWMLAAVAAGSAVVAACALPEPARAVPALAVLLLAVLGRLAMKRFAWDRPFLLWALVPPVLLAAAAAAYPFARPVAPQFTALVAVGLLWVAGRWLVGRYVALRPEAGPFGVWSLAVVIGALAAALAVEGRDLPGVLTACLWIIELVFAASGVAWAWFFAMQFVAMAAGWIARRRPVDADAQLRLTRADRTVRLSLAVPVVAFILMTMTLWSGLYVAAERVIPAHPYPSIWAHYVRLTVPAEAAAPGVERLPAERVARRSLEHAEAAWILIQTAAPPMLVLVAMAGLTMLIAIWSALPSLVAELRPPAADAQTAPSGEWLDRGFRFLWLAGVLLVAGCGLTALFAAGHVFYLLGRPDAVTPSGNAFVWWPPEAFLHWYVVNSAWLLKLFGTAVAGTALGMIAFGGRLKMLTGGLRPVLDVLLDVDNHLREHPRANNPRSRIASRYVSLLRHVCAWKSASGAGYDRLVIVSHSQGTVITTDLLRYLAAYPQPSLERLGREIAVHLVTMGSPLRQLYGRRFPHLYRWAYHMDRQAPDAPLPDTRVPLLVAAPAAAASWTNLYGSGDYVGRYLWYRDESAGRWPLGTPAQMEAPPAAVSRREWCIGAGAHTHYWDREARPVADALHAVIGW
jgi:hypothetical protein